MQNSEMIQKLKTQAERNYPKGTWVCYDENMKMITTGDTNVNVLSSAMRYFKYLKLTPKILYVFCVGEESILQEVM